MIGADTPTNISSSSPEGSKCYDNIWISQQTQKIHTGKCSAAASVKDSTVEKNSHQVESWLRQSDHKIPILHFYGTAGAVRTLWMRKQ